PTQSRRLLRPLDDGFRRAALVHDDDAPVVLVAEEETAVVPARSLGKRETLEHDSRRALTHASRPYSSAGRGARHPLWGDSGGSGTKKIAATSEPIPHTAIARPSWPEWSWASRPV